MNNHDRDYFEVAEQLSSEGKFNDINGFHDSVDYFNRILPYIQSSDHEIRRGVMLILYRLDKEAAFDVVRTLAFDEDDGIRWGCAELLGNYGARAVELLNHLLKNDHCPSVRAMAASMLGYAITSESTLTLENASHYDIAEEELGATVSEFAKLALERIAAKTNENDNLLRPQLPGSGAST